MTPTSKRIARVISTARRLPARRLPARSLARIAPRLAILGAFALAACAGDEAPPPCPGVTTPEVTAEIVAFNDQGRDLTDMRHRASIADATVACEVRADDAGREVVAELNILFETEKGPANESGRMDLPYFVAVVRGDGEILQRRAFTLRLSMPGNQTRGQSVETLAPTIPLAEGARGDAYSLFIGFVLSEDQLTYNRRNAL